MNTFLVLLSVFRVSLGFYDIWSLYEKYQFYLGKEGYLKGVGIGVQPIARFTAVAERIISPGDLVLYVPAEEILTTFDTSEWEEHFKNESSELRGAANLISHKLSLQESKWKDIANLYPSEINTVPSWTDDVANYWLQSFVEHRERLCSNHTNREYFQEIVRNIPDVKELAYERHPFDWSMSVLSKYGIEINKKQWKELRGYHVEKGDELVKGIALVPLFELFNQYLEPDVYHAEPYPMQFSKEGFSLFAQREYKPLQQVYIPYGQKNSHQLLCDSAEVIYHNSHDFLVVKETQASELCEDTSSGLCTFSIYPLAKEATTHYDKLNPKYLAYLKTHKNPLLAYRKGIKKSMNSFDHSLRELRRRLGILDEVLLKLVYQLSVTERVNAYSVLKNIDLALLESFQSKVLTLNS